MKTWLTQAPLPAAWRGRLNLTLGVVLTSAATVLLGAHVKPDPAKLAWMHRIEPLRSSPPPPEDPTTPKPNISLTNVAKSGNKNAVIWALAHGADVHENEYSSLGPVLAADAYPEIVALLHQRGAPEPQLEMAAWANAPNAVTRLLAAHPEHAKHESILRTAASTTQGTASNRLLIVTKILDAGADPNGSPTRSPLAGAIRTCDTRYTEMAGDCMSVVRLLLDRGASVTGDALGAALSLEDRSRTAPLEALLARPLADGVTAHALAEAATASPDDLERIRKLGIDWTWHDGEADEAIPVYSAAQRGDRDYLRVLLDAGGPVDVHYKDGTTALAAAIDNSASNPDSARAVELLVTRGANVNRRFPDGRTPLFAAAESGDIRVVSFLLAHGARVNDVVLDDTALDAADQHANLAAARVLRAHGGRRARPHF